MIAPRKSTKGWGQKYDTARPKSAQRGNKDVIRSAKRCIATTLSLDPMAKDNTIGPMDIGLEFTPIG